MNAYVNTMRPPVMNISAVDIEKEKNQVDGQLSFYNTGISGESRVVRRGHHILEGQLLFFDIGEKAVKGSNVIILEPPTPKKAKALEKTSDDINETIRKNIGLVGYCINQIGGVTSANEDDVYQAGMVALWKAAEGFVSDRGNQFASYAVPAIKRAMFREVSRCHDKLGPYSIDALETENPDIFSELATSEDDAFKGETSPVVDLILDGAGSLRLAKERKGVTALAMYLQGYSGAQIAEAVGVQKNSYTSLISTGRKVVQSNPLFQQATYLWTGSRKSSTVNLLDSEFTLKFSDDLVYDIPTAYDDDYENNLTNFISKEHIADYIVNEVRIGEPVCIINKDTGCTTMFNVGEDSLEVSFAVQLARKMKKSA